MLLQHTSPLAVLVRGDLSLGVPTLEQLDAFTSSVN
jgi:hypothetical protein